MCDYKEFGNILANILTLSDTMLFIMEGKNVTSVNK